MAVNGQRVPFDQIVLNRNRQLLLRLASERREDEYRIEAWYTRSGIEPQRLQIELPEVIGARNSGRTYWQIVMAADRHLFKSPAMMTAEHVWQWTGLWWSREAALNQQSLEQWTGVDEQLMPVGQFNQYLFSTVGSVSAFEVTSFQRWSLLLVVSGIVLVIGLFVLFVPWLHRPVTLLVIGIVLTAMAVWIPELVLLVLQSALAGIVLVGLARLLHVSLRRNLGPVAAAGPVATLDTNSAVLSLLDGSRLGIRSDTERAAEDLYSDKSESEVQAGVVAGSVSEKQA